MASSWYIEKQGRQLGPFTSVQLKQLVVSGQLKPNDSVRRADQPRIVAAGKVKGLFAEEEASQEVLEASPPPIPASNAPGTASAASVLPPPSRGGRLGGVGEGLRNLAEASKAAARLAAAQARKVQLAKITLPAAFLALGKDIHSSGRFSSEFPDLYAEIERLRAEITRLTTGREGGRPA